MLFSNNHAIIAFAALNTVASALPASGMQHSRKGKAVYAITNSEENAIISLPIMSDGKLGSPVLTATSGRGAVSVNATGQAVATDALVSQSAVTVAGQHIFAVNAGSNTVSMMAISPNNPTQLRMVGTPAAVPGTFPNTVSASTKNSMVCVATSGSQAGVSCAPFSATSGIGEMRQISAFNLGQSDPPSGPANTVSHTFFSPDETKLYTTVKGDPMANNTGFLSTIPVTPAANGSCEPMVGTETRSSPNGTAVLFGAAPIPGTNRIFATDPSIGAAILSVDDKTSQASLVAPGPVPDQVAICWATISTKTRTAFVADVGVNRLLEMSLSNASVVGEIDLSAAGAVNPGLIDLRAVGDFVYALSPGNGTAPAVVSVVDVVKRTLVQQADLAAAGVTSIAMGLAVLM